MNKSIGSVRPAAILIPLIFLLCAPGRGQDQPPDPAQAPVLRYEIWADLDEVNKTLRGREDIVWTNRTAEPVEDMVFHLYWNAFKNEASTFLREARAETLMFQRAAPRDGEWGWIDVTSVRLADGPDLTPTMEFLSPDEPANPDDRTVLRVVFPEPVAPGDSVRLHLEFHSKIPRTVARSGYYRNSFFIAKWFPKPGVYEEGRGWNAHEYHQNSEFFADFADFVVHLTVPRDFVVGSSGKQTGIRVDEERGKTTYTYRQSMIHDFAWTAGDRYLKVERDFVADEEVTAEEYERTAELLGLPLEEVKLPNVRMTLLIAPEHKRQIDRHFRALRAAIKYYGLWYGPYPYETVTMVDPPFRTGSGGMEYPTLFTAGTRVLPNKGVLSPEAVIVHEFGHGYWYGLVATNEFEEAWLDEGFNTYSTGRVLAAAYGPGEQAASFNHLPLNAFLRMPKLFDFELNRAAAINVVRYDPVTTWSWKFYNSASYGANVYMRAATLLETLERLLGERTWARILRTYHMRYRYAHPTTADFIAVVNELAGSDLTWFFEELLFATHDFDYGVASVSSVEKPRHLRGVYDIDGKKEEMTSKKIKELERAAAEGREVPPGKEYVTTVVLRRFGEAKVRGDARVEVLVRFKDGSTETRFWDGQARWARLEFVKPVQVDWARVDPQGVWLIDANLANNSRGVDGLRKNVVRLMIRFFYNVQCVLQSLSAWS
jgi:hypothetical protein